MTVSSVRLRALPLCLLAVLVMAACAPPPQSRTAPGDAARSDSQPGLRKVLNLGLRTVLDGFSIAGSGTLAGGGWPAPA
jgi:hypothetical protein